MGRQRSKQELFDFWQILSPYLLLITPYPLLLTPHSSPLTPYLLLLIPYSSLLTPYSSLLTPYSSLLTSHSLLIFLLLKVSLACPLFVLFLPGLKILPAYQLNILSPFLKGFLIRIPSII